MSMLLAIGFSGAQLLILIVVVLLLFGNRLPETMRSLGKSVTEFKKGVREGESSESDEEPKRVEKNDA
jgi:sec-independent protein translocase protein TatA